MKIENVMKKDGVATIVY